VCITGRGDGGPASLVAETTVTVRRMRILHLSDTHVERLASLNADGIDPRTSLLRILYDCALLPDLDLVVITGDVADDGSIQAYVAVRQAVGTFAASRGIPQVYSTGNHDDRANFAEVLGTGHLAVDGTDRGRLIDSLEGERAAVSDVDGHRIITLDTLVPGKGYGWVSDTQLDWLANVLATPSGGGSVLAMHHPPIATERPAQQALMLRNASELAEVIEGSDVLALLCGHFHLQLTGRLGNTPVLVTPGVINRIDLTTELRAERAIRGASATVVELGGPNSPLSYVLHARDPEIGQTAYELSVEEVDEVVAKLGPEPVSAALAGSQERRHGTIRRSAGRTTKQRSIPWTGPSKLSSSP
jgi:Icc protein